MDYRKALIELMRRKANRLKEKARISNYFNRKDAAAIRSWKEDRAFYVWEKIKENIYTKSVSGLTDETCPFCIYVRIFTYAPNSLIACKFCPYGECHGLCYSSGSDYYAINEKVNHGELFPPDWYAKTIEEIESKLKKSKRVKRYNKALVELMRAKNQRLASHISPPPLYFVDADAQSIMEWDGRTARGIWKRICCYVEKGACGLDIRTCPFCLYALKRWGKLDCVHCEYSWNHGVCARPNSVVNKVLEEIDVARLLSNQWYQKTIAQVEKAVLGGKR